MAAVPAPKASVTPAWDDLPGLVLLVGTDGSVRAANADFCAFFGIDAAALGTADWDWRLTEASRAALRAALAACGDFTLQLEATGAGDRPAWLECAGRWIEADRGYVCLLHDITAATRAQAAAQAQAGLFRLLADNVPVLIAYYRASDLQCQFANKAYAQTLRLRRAVDHRHDVRRCHRRRKSATQIEPEVRQGHARGSCRRSTSAR